MPMARVGTELGIAGPTAEPLGQSRVRAQRDRSSEPLPARALGPTDRAGCRGGSGLTGESSTGNSTAPRHFAHAPGVRQLHRQAYRAGPATAPDRAGPVWSQDPHEMCPTDPPRPGRGLERGPVLTRADQVQRDTVEQNRAARPPALQTGNRPVQLTKDGPSDGRERLVEIDGGVAHCLTRGADRAPAPGSQPESSQGGRRHRVRRRPALVRAGGRLDR